MVTDLTYAHVVPLSMCLVLTLTYSPDGSQLAVATLDGTISLWDVQRLYFLSFFCFYSFAVLVKLVV